MGKRYEINLSVIYYFKQSQLVCSAKIEWRCLNCHRTLLSTAFLRSWPTCGEEREMRVIKSQGLGGVGRDWRNSGLISGLDTMLDAICCSQTWSFSTWALATCVAAWSWWTCVCSFDMAVFPWQHGPFAPGDSDFSQLSLCPELESRPCLLFSPWPKSPSPAHAMQSFYLPQQTLWQTGSQFSVHASDNLKEAQDYLLVLLSVLGQPTPPTIPNRAALLPCSKWDLLHSARLDSQIRDVVQGSLCWSFFLVYLTLHPSQCFSSESGNPQISENCSLLLPKGSFSCHLSKTKLPWLTCRIGWGKEWTEEVIFMVLLL